MPLRPRFVRARRTAVTAVFLLLACALGGAPALEGALAAAVPERCFGYGDLLSIARTDWESGLGSWTADRQNVAKPATFDTPNWATRGNLPDGRPGAAAFVPNLLIGDCANDDETGVLILTSPSITIPGGTAVPRVSIDHWFQTEYGWDGGQFRVSVGGGPFNLIPASAIEIVPYNDTLLPALDEWGDVYNSNPFAGQSAYTRTNDAQPTGEWVQSRINLRGIASGGNSIRLRTAFGLDGCTVALPTDPTPVGWFVDEVEVYSCQSEPAPSDCGNGEINGGEQCDDGNNYIDDGCSNTCQVESGWQCTAPTPAGTIPDPGFEAGRPNPFWYEVSNNPIGSPICNAAVCGTGGGSGPYQGTFWVWLGGLTSYQEGSVSQEVVIPTHVTRLTFQLEIPRCDSAADYVELLIDDNREWLADGTSPLCGKKGYTEQTVDVTAYADGGSHLIEFYSRTFASNGAPSNFFIDEVALPANPSACRRIGTSLTLVKNVINDNGGTALRSAWTLSASGPSSFSEPGPVVWGGASLQPGTYDLSESGGAPGYGASAWSCEGGTQIDGETITVAQDEAVTCTITNDDIAPTLTLVNTVVNDNGGGITNPGAFGLRIDGVAAPHGTPTTVRIGDRRVSANGLPGYQLSAWGGDCDADGFVRLSLGQNAVCTITSDDIAPTLTVLKEIVNDSGGTVTDPNAFGLKIDGQPVSHAVVNLVSAGNRIVSESGLPGYVASAWGGDCAPNGSVTLALAQDATCTITNNDQPQSEEIFEDGFE